MKVAIPCSGLACTSCHSSGCAFLRCLYKLDMYPNVLKQNAHWYRLVLVWVVMCSVMVRRIENPFPQTSHLNGLESIVAAQVFVRWRIIWNFVRNCLPHMLQLTGSPTVWITFMCLAKLAPRRISLPHNSHLTGLRRSASCSPLCASNPLRVLNIFGHCSHINIKSV